MNTAPGQVVGPVIQKLMAKRLGVAGITLVLIVVMGLIEWTFVELPSSVHLTALFGPALCAPVFLSIGLRGTRRAWGDPLAPWMTLASASSIIPWGLGAWLVGFRGVAVMAQAPLGPVWALGIVWTVLGFRLLRDSSRIAEVERLASVMMIPAPEEMTPADEIPHD